MLGFNLGFWDYATFVTLFVAGAGFMVGLLVLAQIPGWIAIARNHPDAEAVKVMGWAGFLAVVPWIQAFIWAFKPTDIIDIRRFPAEERAEVAAMIARLAGRTPVAPAASGDSEPKA